MNNKKENTKISKKSIFVNLSVVIIILLVFYISLISIHEIIYIMNDDIALKSIASGTYTGTPSSHMIFSGFPFSTIITTLYKIKNTIDWYGLTLVMSMFFFLGCMIYYTIKNKKDILTKIIYTISILLVTFIIFNVFFVELTFTSVAAFIATCCLILYLLPDSKMKNVIIAIGLVLSFSIRIKACAMVLVFFVPALFYKNHSNKIKLKKDLLFGLIIAALLGGSLVIEKSFYTGKGWQEYLEYNDARSLYYDYYYPILALGENSDEIAEMYNTAGFNEIETELLRSYGGTAFYDDIPQKLIQLMTNCKKTIKINVDMNAMVKELIKRDDNTYYVMTLFALSIAIITATDRKKKAMTIIPFILLQITLLLYLASNGRMPDRVMVPLFTCFVLTNLYILFQVDSVKNNAKRVVENGKALLLIPLLISFLLAINVRIESVSKPFDSSSNTMQAYFNSHPDNFYIYDNNNLEKFKLHKEFKQNNFINMSGWTAFSPLHKEAIKNQNANSLKELLFKENVYMVLEAVYPVENYQLLEPNVKIEQVDSIDRFYVYKFSRTEKVSNKKESTVNR